MSLIEYVGAAFVEVDGQDFDVQSFEIKQESGIIPVKTMNRTGKNLGFARGITTYTITGTAAIPKGKSAQWINMIGVKFTHEAVGGGYRVSYRDCVCTEQSEKYTVDGEAQVDFTLTSTDRVEE